jgi:hypothetical protein
VNVFVVTSGEYSSYSIDAVFSTKDLALAYVSNNQNIEEFELDPAKEECHRGFLVEMFPNGDVTNVVEAWINNKESHSITSGNMLEVWCRANDADHAVKIAGEIRRNLMASNQWGVK